MARLLAVLIILFPVSFIRVDDRGTSLSPIVIHLQKNSPAYAAFEDMNDDYPHHVDHVSTPVSVSLASGKAFVPPRQMLKNETKQLVALSAIKINNDSTSKTIKEKVDWDEALLPVEMDNSVVLSDRKQRILAALSPHDLAVQSVADRARELVDEALDDYDPYKKVVETTTGTPIVVVKPRETAKGSEEEAQGSSFKITGKIELQDGAGDSDLTAANWKFYRLYNEQVNEMGQVDPVQGEFTIRVRDRRGQLVAELRDRSGRIVGRGKTQLNQAASYVVNVKPTESDTVASFTDGSFGNKNISVPVDYGDRVFRGNSTIVAFGDPLERYDQKNKFDVNQFVEGSQFFVEAFSPDTFSTVSLTMKEGVNKIRLFSKSMAKAFFSIVSSYIPEASDSRWATIWGRVLKNGQAVSGARIEVAGSGETTYFNELFIPTARLNKTTSSGEFAVVKVQPGVQAVRVEFEGRTYPARVLPTFAGRFTQVDVEIPTQFRRQLFNIYDILKADQSVATTLRIVGLEETYDLDRQPAIEIPQMKDGVTVELDSGYGYELLRTHLPSMSEEMEIHLPAIREDWLNTLVADSKEGMDRRLGVAIGFVGETDTEVVLMNNPSQLDRTVFFDRDMKIFRGNFAPAGGGFIKFNIPIGFQTFKLQAVHSAQAFVESFVSEPYFLHLVGSQSFAQASGKENP